jgi:hypothetical protein
MTLGNMREPGVYGFIAFKRNRQRGSPLSFVARPMMGAGNPNSVRIDPMLRSDVQT